MKSYVSTICANEMSSFLTTFCLIAFCTLCHAATIITHQGSTTPSTEGWGGGNLSNSNVTAGAYNDKGSEVWRITDPGVIQDGKANNLNYTKSYDDTVLLPLLTTGWSLSGVLSIPSETGANKAWGAGSDTWLGIYYKLSSTQRVAFGLLFGRDSLGQTLLAMHGDTSATLTLAPGYHKYEMLYSPETLKTSIFVDNVFWREYSGALSSVTNSATQVYWGDNNSQGGEARGFEREAFWQNVTFASVPEPTPTLLGFFAVIYTLCFYRKRKSSL